MSKLNKIVWGTFKSWKVNFEGGWQGGGDLGQR